MRGGCLNDKKLAAVLVIILIIPLLAITIHTLVNYNWQLSEGRNWVIGSLVAILIGICILAGYQAIISLLDKDT